MIGPFEFVVKQHSQMLIGINVFNNVTSTLTFYIPSANILLKIFYYKVQISLSKTRASILFP